VQHRTEVERRLWQRLRNRQLNGAKFRRQHPIGSYVVDLFCLEPRLVIELDASMVRTGNVKLMSTAPDIWRARAINYCVSRTMRSSTTSRVCLMGGESPHGRLLIVTMRRR
jgi:very-short-patch-repair endonuclease